MTDLAPNDTIDGGAEDKGPPGPADRAEVEYWKRLSRDAITLQGDAAGKLTVARAELVYVQGEYEKQLMAQQAEIASLRAKLESVCAAAYEAQRAFEDRAECNDCDDKAEQMGGRCDPLCDICMERWAKAEDAIDDALEEWRERGGK